MSTEVGGATYVIDARVEGLQRGMAKVKAEFREVSKSALRVQENADQAFRAFGGSLQMYLGASVKDADKVARAWSRATGISASEMGRVAEAGKRTGASFHEMTAALVHSKNALGQAARGTGQLHAALAKYNPEAAMMLRYTTNAEQRHAVLNRVLKDQRGTLARAEIEMAAYGKASNRAATAVLGLRTRVGELTRAYAPLAAALAAGALTVAFKRIISGMDQMGKSAQKIGISVEELSKLEYAGRLADVSLGDLETSVGRLSKSLAEIQGGKANDAGRALKAMGIAATDAQGALRSTPDILKDVADAFAGMQDGAGKTALAMALFGRSGAAMIPMLNGGRASLAAAADELERFGGVVTPEAAKQAENFNDNLTRLRVASEALIKQVVTGLLPGLVQISEQLVAAAKSSGVATTAAIELAHAYYDIKQAIVEVSAYANVLRQNWDDPQGWEVSKKRWAEASRVIADSARANREAINSLRGNDPRALLQSVDDFADKMGVGGKGDLGQNINLGTHQIVRPAPSFTAAKPEKSARPPRETIDATRREVENYIRTLNDEVAALQREIDTFGLSNAAKARAMALAKLSADATAAERAEVEKAADAIAAKTQELENLEFAQKAATIEVERAQAAMEAQNEALQAFSAEMQESFFNVLKGTESVGEAFVRMSQRMIDAMMEAVIFGNGPFAGLFGSQGTNGGPGGLFGSLLGAVIPSARPSLYAAGGTARGRIIVGEEGPELLEVPGGSRITPTEHVGARIRRIMEASARPAMAGQAAAATQGTVVNFTAAVTVHADGASPDAAQRIRREIEQALKQERERLPRMIADARRRGKV